jgi:hypothetical protein
MLGKMIILSYIILCFIAGVYNTPTMLEYILFAYVFQAIHKKEQSKKYLKV